MHNIDEGQTSDLTLYPGQSTMINLVLHNIGDEDKFNLKIEPETTAAESPQELSSILKYHCTPQVVSLKREEMREIEVFLQISNDALEGTSVVFTVSAESTNHSENNNFLNIFAIISKGPRDILLNDNMVR